MPTTDSAPYNDYSHAAQFGSAAAYGNVDPTQRQPTRSGFVRLPRIDVRLLTSDRTIYVPAYSGTVALQAQGGYVGYSTRGPSPFPTSSGQPRRRQQRQYPNLSRQNHRQCGKSWTIPPRSEGRITDQRGGQYGAQRPPGSYSRWGRRR